MNNAAFTATVYYCNYDKGFCISMTKRNPNGVHCSFHVPRVSTRVFKSEGAAQAAAERILAKVAA